MPKVLIKRFCRVPNCRLKDCKLRSHLLYAPRIQRSDEDTKCTALQGFSKEQIQIGRDGVDGFPKLPFDEPMDSETRVLFNHFFNSTFDRLISLVRGTKLDPAFKGKMLALATNSQAYVWAVLTQSTTDISIRRNDVSETRKGLEIYNETVAASRKVLAVIQLKPDPLLIELALLVLCNLVTYDAMFSRWKSVALHRAGMIHLVNVRGGIHNLTTSLPYVLHVDRQIAYVLSISPAFINTNRSLLKMPRPSWSKQGNGLDMINIDPRVSEYCLKTTEILDLSEIIWTGSGQQHRRVPSFTSNDRDSPLPASAPKAVYGSSFASSQYFFYSRDYLDEEFSILNADLLPSPTTSGDGRSSPRDTIRRTPSTEISDTTRRSIAILHAARLIEYTVTWRNMTPPHTNALVRALYSILHIGTRSGGKEPSSALQAVNYDLMVTWASHIDVLTWILFVIVVITPSTSTYSSWTPEGMARDWAMEMLRDLISAKYTNISTIVKSENEEYLKRTAHWPVYWPLRELENLRRFVWSSFFLTQRFREVCEELQRPKLEGDRRSSDTTTVKKEEPYLVLR